jgi:hypothetical protein
VRESQYNEQKALENRSDAASMDADGFCGYSQECKSFQARRYGRGTTRSSAGSSYMNSSCTEGSGYNSILAKFGKDMVVRTGKTS